MCAVEFCLDFRFSTRGNCESQLGIFIDIFSTFGTHKTVNRIFDLINFLFAL